MIVFQWAFRYTGSHEDAEDILQETFIKAFKNIPSLRQVSKASFAHWLKQICVRTSLNLLRNMKRRKRDQTFSISQLVIEPASQQRSPEDIVQIQDLYRHIQGALQMLPAKQCIIFEMRHSQNKSIKEISELMNCSVSNVKSHLSRSLKRLKKQMLSLREA